MSFFHSYAFKRIKNFVIGAGAALVMLGALGKLLSAPWGSFMITVGLVTEAILFLMLGILPPEKDYYWEKLYPGLDKAAGGVDGAGLPVTAQSSPTTPLDGEIVQNNLEGMLTELKGMSKSLGSLKALQEVDFSETGDKIKAMDDFYGKMTQAMSDMVDTADDVKKYKSNIASLNKNLSSLNNVYGGMLNVMGNKG